ncbi:MAG: histidine kinase [Gammaproteobacteria bacterium]
MRWTIGGRLAFGMGAIIALFLMSDLIVNWRDREFNALGSGLRLFALLASVAVGFLTLRAVTRPVSSLLAETQALVAGDLSRRALPESDDEIGQLANAFNQMAEVLERNAVSRTYLDNVIRSMSESLIVVSPTGVIETVNPASCSLLDYPERDLTGSSIQRVLGLNDTALTLEFLFTGVTEQETYYYRRDGQRIPVLFSAAPLRARDGSLQGAVCIALDIVERRRTQRALAASRAQLRKLVQYLNLSREEERTQIARELHDQLGQSLTGIKMDIAWIQRRVDDHEASDQRIAERLNAMSRHVDATVSLVRRVATELRPAVLDNLGLVPALDLLLRQFNERTGIGVEPSLDASVDLTPTQATALYRIAQEALTNVARHAQARWVRLRIDHSEGTARLEVRDDGRGIVPSDGEPRRSLGLLGIEERARELGGMLSIGGPPGTTLTVTFPIRPSP